MRYPGRQAQSSGLKGPVMFTLCAGQLAHPPYRSFGNSPGRQGTQADAPASLVLPTGHLMHWLALVWPTMVE
jgi:hypothetical protein